MKTLYKNTSGATSLLLVVGMALVFITLVAGLTTLSIRESQQATGNDLSNRALVAAQAAARDAALIIDKNPNATLPSDCTDTSNPVLPVSYELDGNDNNKTTIVCRTVQSGGEVQDQIATQDSLVSIYPSTSTANLLTLRWGLRNDLSIPAVPASCPTIEIGGRTIPTRPCTAAQDPVAPQPLPDTYQPYSPIQVNNAAIMEVNVLSYPSSGGSGDANSLATSTLLITPLATPKNYSPVGLPGTIIQASSKCGDNNTDYLCIANIDLSKVVPAGNNLVAVQFKPRYKDTALQTQLYNSSNPSTPLQAGQSSAIIDVTAKVGDYYRRIQLQKPLNVSGISNSYFSDVLYSNETICKRMDVLVDGTLNRDNFCAR